MKSPVMKNPLMKNPVVEKPDYLEAFIKTAQYLAGLTAQQDMWREAGKALVNFFGAALCAIGTPRADGEIADHHWVFSDSVTSRGNLGPETKDAFTEVLESSFLTLRRIHNPDPLSMVFLPINQKGKVTDVILVAHKMSGPIPNELLNVYLAVSRLIGTMAERLTSETELRKHRDHLDELVKDRTMELTKSNEKLQREIIERKQVEGKLKESEAEKKAILDGMTTSVRLVDKERTIKWINKAGLVSVNKSLEEVIGHKCFEFWGDNSKKPCVSCPASEILKFKRPVQGRRHSSNRTIWDFRAEPVFDENGDIFGIIEISDDITDKSRLEAALNHSKKMDAIATLAGGVAHEFNNALMGIMGNIELLKIDLDEDKQQNKSIVAMSTAGHRMSRLTDQLLAYAEGGKYQSKALKLDNFVIETLPILRHDLSPTVKVETHFPKDISYVSADPTQMQMVLSAVLTNSNESIEGDGYIRITAENKDIDEDFKKQHSSVNPVPHVCLTIEDNGKGMDKETRTGIFEPFFTTKFQGRGMGMAAVYGIIRNHDGRIFLESESGKGTTVRIYLPAIETEAEMPEKTNAEFAMGSGTILLIEDEDVVIDVTRALLEILGYRVLVAKTGKDAVHISETFDDRIDLALLDIKLPDMDGRNLYPLIMKARPNLKVIVCSGYSIDGPAREILNAGAQDFIQKPFSVAILSGKLKEVLKGEQPLNQV